MDTPTLGQLLTLGLSTALFAVGAGASIARPWSDRRILSVLSTLAPLLGLGVALVTLVWHSADRGSWFPLEDNFDALVWLGVLLAGFVVYVQHRRPLRGLDWFVLPIVVLLLVAAAVFGRLRVTEYNVHSAWHWVHRVTSYGGAVAFAVAGAVGTMYLVVQHRLRQKSAPPGPGLGLGSLERLEHVTLSAVTLGFALLTVGIITGIARLAENGSHTQLGSNPFASPKVILGFAVWVVYGLVLHSPINPSFRGRRAAMLSVVGFVLMIGSIVATQFV